MSATARIVRERGQSGYHFPSGACTIHCERRIESSLAACLALRCTEVLHQSASRSNQTPRSRLHSATSFLVIVAISRHRISSPIARTEALKQYVFGACPYVFGFGVAVAAQARACDTLILDVLRRRKARWSGELTLLEPCKTVARHQAPIHTQPCVCPS